MVIAIGCATRWQEKDKLKKEFYFPSFCLETKGTKIQDLHKDIVALINIGIVDFIFQLRNTADERRTNGDLGIKDTSSMEHEDYINDVYRRSPTMSV